MKQSPAATPPATHPARPAAEFSRDQRFIATRITADGRDGFPVQAGRYRLVVSRACPWANRSVIVRRLLGLEDALSMGITGPVHDERSWTFDLDPGGRDPVLHIERLQQAYFARFPGYDRGITVPAIVDIPTGKVVTNDFPQITLDLSTQWRAYHRPGAPDLYPEDRRGEIDKAMPGSRAHAALTMLDLPAPLTPSSATLSPAAMARRPMSSSLRAPSGVVS